MAMQKKVKDLEVIKEYYGYSNQKAKKLLTYFQMTKLKI